MRGWKAILGLAVLQAALVLGYLAVERARTGPVLPLGRPVPDLSFRTRDGRALRLRALDRPTLLHVWATWCPPCREELPGLLALHGRDGIDVLAVALDPEWAPVERFLGTSAPEGGSPSVGAAVVLGDPARLRRSLDVRSVPVTFLVEGGRLRTRLDGARDWRDPATLVEAGVDP